MLEFILALTGLFSVLSGLLVLYRGDWRPFALKYAGVAFSTTSSIFFTYVFFRHGAPFGCEDGTGMCKDSAVYGIIQNVAFIIFHFAFGRDAVKFKQGDRRAAFRPSYLNQAARHER